MRQAERHPGPTGRQDPARGLSLSCPIQRLHKNQAENLFPRHAQRAQASDHRPALHYAEGDGVVDEKHANHQSQQAQRRQVEPKRPRHLADGAVACFAGGNILVAPKIAASCSMVCLPCEAFVDDQVDAVQPPDAPQHLLCGGDISNEQRLQGAPAQVIVRGQQPYDLQ